VRVFSSDALNGYPWLNTLSGVFPGDQFGWALAPIGDPGGTATPRLLISFVGRASGSLKYAGGAEIDDVLNGNVLATIAGSDRNEFLGISVASAGDLDRDGRDDFALGAPLFSPAGRFLGGCIDVFSTPAGGGNATRLFRRSGSAEDRLGQSLAFVGDVDGDGAPDLLAGATGEIDPANGFATGAVHVVRGRRPRFVTDQPHYKDLDPIALDAIAFAGLPAFVMVGTSLSGRNDYLIDFSTPWFLVKAPDADAFGATSLHGTLPDLMGVPITVYAQALLPYAPALHHKTLFSELVTISIN